MSEKVLSQEEISALLEAVSGEEESTAAPLKPEEKAEKKSGAGTAVKIGKDGYLFPLVKAQTLSKEVESTLTLIFDAFAHKGAATLSTMFRTQVGFKLNEMEQMFYGDFIESLPEPSSMWYLKIDPIQLHLALCLEPALVHTIITTMLGGGHMASSPGRQTITDLEQSIIESAILVFCTELSHAWSRVSEIDLTIDNRETRPRLLRIYPPNEGMVIVAMSMKVGMTESGIYWGIPSSVLKSLQESLSHHRKIESEEKLIELASSIKATSLSFPTRLEAELDPTEVALSELLRLEVGDVLKIEHLVEKPAAVKVNRSEKFSGNVVISNDHKAVRLTATEN